MISDVLIIEDEDDIRQMIAGILEDEGYETREASSSEQGLDAIRAREPSLVVLDVWLKGSSMDGIELLTRFKEIYAHVPVIIISGHGTVETAVSAIRKGAYDYIVKPFKAEKLLVTAQRALENAQLKQENAELKGKAPSDTALIGQSAIITQLRQKISRIAATNSRVLISGASGTGKELLARLLHMQSNRAKGPFRAVNAASMVPERVEEELFGSENADGSFINAVKLAKPNPRKSVSFGASAASRSSLCYPPSSRMACSKKCRILICCRLHLSECRSPALLAC